MISSGAFMIHDFGDYYIDYEGCRSDINDNDDDDDVDEKKLEAVGRPQALIQLHPLLFLLTLPSLEPSSGVFSIVFSS